MYSSQEPFMDDIGEAISDNEQFFRGSQPVPQHFYATIVAVVTHSNNSLDPLHSEQFYLLE